MDETILVQELGHLLEFSYTDMLCYAGPHSRHGVAGAFKAMHSGHSRVVPNQPPPRLSVVIRAAYSEPGSRDCFEAVIDGRYIIDPTLAQLTRGRPLQGFVYQVSVNGRTATLLMCPGFITAEFFEFAGKAERDHAEEGRPDEMKTRLAQRILAVSAEDVYELVQISEISSSRSKSIAADRDLIAVE
jgi:hypothetical protein